MMNSVARWKLSSRVTVPRTTEPGPASLCATVSQSALPAGLRCGDPSATLTSDRRMDHYTHPSVDIQGSESRTLSGVRIALGVTGSVAVTRTVEIARGLMRHGADVFPVMSRAATELIQPALLEWATGQRPVTELTGAIEHVALAGSREDRADLILIAPATANTIGKTAAGIDDTPVTTLLTTALGSGIPVLMVPAMHEPMYRHPLVTRNMETLREIGIGFVMPDVSEGKAKIADTRQILAAVVAALDRSHSALTGRRLLITAGRTVEYLDPVRVITNNSTGRMGRALAEQALAAGAEVTVVWGKASVEPPAGTRAIRVDTADQMRETVEQELRRTHYDILLAAAAVSDWKPAESSDKKIATHGSDRLTVELVPTAKIIDNVKEIAPQLYLVAFRAVYGLSKAELEEDARARCARAKADLIAVNDVSAPGAGFETTTNAMTVFTAAGRRFEIELGSKEEVAAQLFHMVGQELGTPG